LQSIQQTDCMTRVIYVFISENKTKCYLYLKHLTEDNPQVPYFKTWRALKTQPNIVTETYKIDVSRLIYKTKRGFNKKNKEEVNEWD
jgi:hypothetical protein